MPKYNMTDEEWDQHFRDWFPHGPIVPRAIKYAREHLEDGESVDDLMDLIETNWPGLLIPGQIVSLAGGIVPEWSIERGTRLNAKPRKVDQG